MKYQRRYSILALALISMTTIQSCTTASTSAERAVASDKDYRGSPGQYDPGPEKGSKWGELFGSTPNYRGIADAVLGGSAEKFRWQFGPMWYRGRLGENEVKVFLVGQEGAQDENISNRAFTGSTGTKMQNFLNHLGIRHSYIFLNTFVYTINGQLEKDEKFKWLEQGKGSPIVDYRHKLFDHMAATNRDSLSLLVGVGSGGKASLMSWIRANGGECRSWKLDNCELSGVERKFGLKKKLFAVGVPHPGGASPRNGGEAALQNIMRGFDFAIRKIEERIASDSSWLPVDTMNIDGSGGSAKRGSKFRYTNAPVPHWDFAFGTNWRMGKKGTSSNRQGSDSIQVFSDDGKYNAEGARLKYENLHEPKDFQLFTESGKPIPEMMSYSADGGQYVGDLPYESPKFIPDRPDRVNMYDYGPCGEWTYGCELSELLMGQLSGYEWPDFSRLGVTQHQSFGTGAIYRGQLKKAKVLILADQMSHDDFFSTRALTGDAGQKLQTFLKAAGIGQDYAIIRTLPVDTLDLENSDRERVVMDPQVVKVRNRILKEVMEKSGTQVVISFGRFAKVALEAANLGGVKKFHLVESTDRDHVSQWNETLVQLGSRDRYSGKNSTISRYDLPSHTRWWMGSSGDRARRAFENGKPSPNYYMVTAPEWVKRLKPERADMRAPSRLDTFLDGLGVNEEGGDNSGDEE